MSEDGKEYQVELMKRYETMSPSRLEGESFEEYKERRKATNSFLKQHLKGRRIA